MKSIAWFVTAIVLLCGQHIWAQQSNSPDLFTYGDRTVSLSEFEYVFFKNNPNNSDPTIQDLKDYLDLYINFKLKVAEAHAQQIDTLPNVRRDLSNYLEQLFTSSLEKLLMDSLVAEAQERIQHDVRVKHILVSVGQDAAPEDTLKAYQKIMSVRDRLIKGEDFDKVALEVSEDNYVQENKGDIGYITALSIPFYNFETAAYSTPVGSVSLPVRTRLGYHLIKPTDRRSALGTIQVAHILVKVPEQGATEEDFATAEAKADSLYGLIQKGQEFEEIARQHSDDQMSRSNGGVMEPFGAGRMIPSFEIAAYNLEEDGAISEPFRTRYGYHIIKRLNRKPVGEEDVDVSDQLKSKIKRDQRYNVAREQKLETFKRQYSFIEFPDRLEPLKSLVDSSLIQGRWNYKGLGDLDNKDLFMLKNQSYTSDDFMTYVAKMQVRQRSGDPNGILENMYENFKERSILEYGISRIDKDYPLLKQEYNDGILMFALMDEMVWSRAIRDTSGLEDYYANHKSDHMWDKRAEAVLYTIHDRDKTEKVVSKASKWDAEKMMRKFNKDPENPVLEYQKIKVEKGGNALVDSTGWKNGVGDVHMLNDSTAQLVKVLGTVPPEPKKLSEARGAFISDYQQFLEKRWVQGLREKYPIKVKEEELKKLVD